MSSAEAALGRSRVSFRTCGALDSNTCISDPCRNTRQVSTKSKYVGLMRVLDASLRRSAADFLATPISTKGGQRPVSARHLIDCSETFVQTGWCGPRRDVPGCQIAIPHWDEPSFVFLLDGTQKRGVGRERATQIGRNI